MNESMAKTKKMSQQLTKQRASMKKVNAHLVFLVICRGEQSDATRPPPPPPRACIPTHRQLTLALCA